MILADDTHCLMLYNVDRQQLNPIKNMSINWSFFVHKHTLLHYSFVNKLIKKLFYSAIFLNMNALLDGFNNYNKKNIYSGKHSYDDNRSEAFELIFSTFQN